MCINRTSSQLKIDNIDVIDLLHQSFNTLHELSVVHVFGKHLTSVTVGRALNRDQWHNVVVTIDVHGARLIAKVDQLKEEVYLKVKIHFFLYHDLGYQLCQFSCIIG